MNICFVIQEVGKVPSGVVSVVQQLLSGWYANDRIFVLMNKDHWAFGPISLNISNCHNMTISKLPFKLLSEKYFDLELTVKNRFVLFFVKVMIIFFRQIEMLVTTIFLRRWLKNKSIHMVISHNGGWPGGELNRWVMWAAWLSKINCRYLVIHNLPWSPRFIIKPFDLIRNRLVEVVSTKLITVSKSCALSLQEGANFTYPPNVIYNGVLIPKNVSGYKDSVKGNAVVSIGFVGELHPRKGVDVLINSLRYVDKPCELLLIGNGDRDYEKKLRFLSEKQQWNVKFIGFVADMSRYYPLFDIVVLPSVGYESFGMTLVEAMSYSIPTVCSDFGGMKEVVKDGVTGYVVPANDPQILGNKLNYLVANLDIRLKLGDAGKKRVFEKFSTYLMVSNYKELCHEVC